MEDKFSDLIEWRALMKDKWNHLVMQRVLEWKPISKEVFVRAIIYDLLGKYAVFKTTDCFIFVYARVDIGEGAFRGSSVINYVPIDYDQAWFEGNFDPDEVQDWIP